MEKLLLAIGVVIVAVCGASVWHVLHPAEPYYQGKALSVWLRQHYDCSRLYYESAQSKQRLADADSAIRQIGTNALPVLLKMTASDQSPPRSIVGFYFWASFQSRANPHVLAETGFEVLGPIAKPGVPDLVRLLNSTNDQNRVNAAIMLSAIGPAANDAVPGLIQHLADTNALVNMMCIIALGKIHGKPELAVPALLPYLAITPIPSYAAIKAIGEFGADARGAVPALTNLLVYPQLSIRRDATNALKAIAPEAIPKLEAK